MTIELYSEGEVRNVESSLPFNLGTNGLGLLPKHSSDHSEGFHINVFNSVFEPGPDTYGRYGIITVDHSIRWMDHSL